ncbi:hypothetical protein SERLADRAFT_434137 [Serpula lacrymans var. lacrymans S7.9]|uniref:Uncharacterized protein n=2 Tax=Serpula lacrymans var. lacrymans TaxID=341189 RepID=F8NJN7_SERL9|nr:uncharacterized protein SERLADRAFT_434137 [Serpula lacrymans var. lacrymans S7.9]EGO28252.1 hypothetical protein SERLADRAFT_434137 [Serpula lacrymans var. lacrymans S7.9]
MVTCKEPLCHYGKEATVAVIAAFLPTNYNPLPVLVSPTCKNEMAAEAVCLIQTILDCLSSHPDGENCFGPIWCFLTDGDSTRRQACYTLFMCKELTSNNVNGLFEVLSRLPGLNLFTGSHNVTIDSDPKHLIKRKLSLSHLRQIHPSNHVPGHATLICSPQGNIINNVTINCKILTL